MQGQILKLLNERYFLDDNEKTWEDLSKRVSQIYPDIEPYITDMRFVPSSPTLMNANTGGKRKGTLSSCFTMGIEDSIEGIMDSLKECAIVTKASGGVGYVFSQLRSSKEGIKGLNGKLSSGPLPFANMLDSVLNGIHQGGVRRGAGMFQYDIDAPDILEVIRAKDKKGVLERFNVSIRVTDEFYKKLQTNPDFPHIVYFKDGTSMPLEDAGKIVSVKKLWDEITEYAWRCAEPGIFNVDIATRQCTTTNLDPVVLSNPCLTKDAVIKTFEGDITIEELYNRGKDIFVDHYNEETNDIESTEVGLDNISVYSYNEETEEIELKKMRNLWLTKKETELMEIEMEDGKTLRLTPDHRVYTTRGWVEAQHLLESDEIMSFV